MTRVWRAGAEEAGVVAGLLAEFRDWMGRSRPTAESLVASVERLMGDPDTDYLLGRPEGREAPSGVCQLRFRYGVWHAATDCWLEDLFVREDSRAGGVGSALVEKAVERARERGCARVELDVNEANGPALALYERFGFSASTKAPGGKDLLMRLMMPEAPAPGIIRSTPRPP